MIIVFFALMLLRVMIGFHFFSEGTDKLRNGFDAQYFLVDAKGPLAPLFRGIVRDVDGRERLCVEDVKSDNGEMRVDFNPKVTFLLWEDFIGRCAIEYGFGSDEKREEIAGRREKLKQEILTAREEMNTRIDTAALELRRADLEQDSIAIRDQTNQAFEILTQHKEALQRWLIRNRVELVSHFSTSDRVEGFDRDGTNRSSVASGVASINWQVNKIKNDRLDELNGWKSEVGAIWDSFESQINGLATEEQKSAGALTVHRPFDQETSNLDLINSIIPWFDTIVGVLLILGLFSRFASLLGAGFLASVIATQPPWIAGAAPTWYQAIELFALLVIFATCAGRCGGLDYFLHAASKNPDDETDNVPV